MREKDLNEDLATMAYKAEADHEVQMARADLYKIAKYAIQMHEMLKGVTEEQGLEGWVQSKITKASDYLGAVYHHMDYEQKFESVAESTDDDVDESGIMYKAGVKKYGKEGMKKIQSAAGKGASAEEIGAIKDKHNKKKKESIEEGRMAGYSKYHCKDCGCQMHNCKPDCNCEHDSHDETGSWWRDENGNGVPDVMETSYTHTLLQRLEEAKKKKGLYYNVNKRKKAGTSRKKGHPDAPTDQDWKNAAKTAKESVEGVCSECGKPSYTTLPEEKQKGVDGKVCWKGYKRMGTKKKGGKTVDNCVKM